MIEVAAVEREIDNRPNEVWLVSTFLDEEWAVYVLRTGNEVQQELSIWGTSLSLIDPSTLNDLTRPENLMRATTGPYTKRM